MPKNMGTEKKRTKGKIRPRGTKILNIRYSIPNIISIPMNATKLRLKFKSIKISEFFNILNMLRSKVIRRR